MTIEVIFSASTPEEFRAELAAVLESIEAEHSEYADLLWRDGSPNQEWFLLASRMRAAMETAGASSGTRHLLHQYSQPAARTLQR